MPQLRLIAWNCRRGRLSERLDLLRPHEPDVVFVQECGPEADLPLFGEFLRQTINPRKGIALGCTSSHYELRPIAQRAGCGNAVLAAEVTGPITFAVLGIWSNPRQGKNYVDDVVSSLNAYEDVLRNTPTVIMGDLNSGSNLNTPSEVSKKHSRLLKALAAFDVVSAYHAFHGVEHGNEQHPTYRHAPRSAEPWHIDFCFVPETWRSRIKNVELLDDEHWRRESDHHPLKVDLQF